MSDAARASLASVRAAQDAARGRARRETRRTRAWVGGILGGIAVGVLVFGPRMNRPDAAGKAAPPAASISAAPSTGAAPSLPSRATAQIAPPASAIIAGDTTSPAVGRNSDGASPTAAAPSSSPEVASNAAADDACTASFGQHRWRLSVESCTQAFQAHPRDATLALKIAQAHHARARLPEAGEWASRALALDPGLAEAYVIVAHSERHGGRPAAALEAYRRYLTLAPRGWHASEARAAVRAHGREKSAGNQPSPSAASGTAAASTTISAAVRSGG